MLKPTCDRILVTLNPPENKTEGGIIVPTVAADNQRVVRGTVAAVGLGRQLDDGSWIPMFLHEGDTVIFDKMLAVTFVEGSDLYYCLHQTDVLAYITTV